MLTNDLPFVVNLDTNRMFRLNVVKTWILMFGLAIKIVVCRNYLIWNATIEISEVIYF
ncbi:MAG: hypothetical protein F6K48_30620 [Okeania sp. SIO3H1]|uniref:hypothetical protein n=1 Tax=Okeania sp. SIO1I7 TaxID=2607772 RepID=UPI0013C57E48|nr:hypothetical protein [Okeania sp. SIO1I7]NEN93009.1 hypothetical protein [Okeania sp. SIO3H1]NET27315.1 hypothetical protein [Okeania sp. SIO1I7]